MAALVSLGALILYGLTLAPTTHFWDTSEYTAAAYVLGTPHPPGNPLFTIIAHVWGLLPLAAGYAMRINLLAGVTSAVAAGCWFLVGERWMRAWVPAVWPRRLAALAGAICSATAFTVWNQSVVNEKVYTLSLLSVALVLWLIVRWDDQPPGEAHDHHLLLIVYLLALTATNHMMGVLVGPVVVILLLPPLKGQRPPDDASRREEWSQWFLFCCVYALIVATGLENSMPLKAAGVLFLAALANSLFRARNWDLGLAVVFGALGLLGAWRHWKADLRTALAMTTLMTTFTLLLIFYLNFKYGYSQRPDLAQALHEVRERDYFFIASFALWGVWVGMGLATLMEWLTESLETREPDPARRWLLATPVLLLALVPLVGNHLTASRRGETLARDFAYDMLQSVEPYGVLVTAGDNDTFPLWYAQEVEHIRQDVTVVNLSLANTDWYLRQLQRRPLATFDSTAAPSIYRARAWPKPAGRLLDYTDEQLAHLEPVYWLDQKRLVNLGGVSVSLDPQQLGRQYLERADVIVLEAIKDQMGKRPIYFSRTVGPYADLFGLSDYLEGQGFARKLHREPLTPSDSIVSLGAGLGAINLPRTTALAFDVYHRAAAGRLRPRGWVDRPSESILATYGIVYQALAQVLRQRKPELATRALVVADSVFKNTTYGFNPPSER